MPIHNQGYRRREAGTAGRRVFRAAPIAFLTLRQILGRRAMVAVGLLSLAPLLPEALAVFVLARFPDLASMVPPLKELLGLACLVQLAFGVLLTVWAGTGLVADDFRTGALVVYFSRPLTRADYLVGKLAVLAGLNLLVTAVPMVLLWALAVALDPRDLATRGLAWMPLAIVALCLLASLVLAAAAMAAGAVTRNGTLGAALLMAGLVSFDVAAAAAPEGAALPLRLLALRRHAVALMHALFGSMPDPAGLHWGVALVCLLLVAAGSGALIWRRLQAVEVV